MSPHSRPRPILKPSKSKQFILPPSYPACGGHPVHSPHVHFPPTPCLVQSTHPAHSPRTYDRKPIIVSPQTYDLPSRDAVRIRSPPIDFEVERPVRGRSGNPMTRAATVKGSYFHPRAFEACEPEPLADSAIRLAQPPLPEQHASYASESEDEDEYDCDDSDDSGDSDDSDVVLTPPDLKPSNMLSDAHQVYSAQSPSLSCTAGLPRDSSDIEKSRPHLVRASEQPSIVPLREYTIMIVDEGCLGGF